MYDASDLESAAQTMEKYGLTSVEFVDSEGSKLKIERASTQIHPQAPAPAQLNAATASAPAVFTPVAVETQTDASHTSEVLAPMVGVFYAAPAPGAEPFVHVGSRVKKGDTLCILEAMKMMNEVTAERDGEIVEICVEDSELVEYGRVLFKLY